jgi:UTP-glucose-1-phosphate uridylyltransferase
VEIKPALLVMAAGMGARYGGLKQIDPVGPNDEILIDYTVYDAIRAGFSKLVLVIRHSFEDEFRRKISGKFDTEVETLYAYQELDCRIGKFRPPAKREKPWGTGHAVLVAKDLIDEPFAVVNADDYYGRNSLVTMAEFLSSRRASRDADHAMVGYVLRNTLSEFGSVARGVCDCDEKMLLRNVEEHTGIEKSGRGARALGRHGDEVSFTGDEIVSMNLWGFRPSIFDWLERYFLEFLEEKADDLNAELYLPSVVGRLIRSRGIRVKVLPTHDEWFGITYRGDREIASASIRKLIVEGVYPEKLW